MRTTFEYDESHRLREVRNHGAGLPSFTYSLDGAGRRLGMTQHSGASALHTTYTYDEAGRLVGETGLSGGMGMANSFLFNGQQYEPETGLYHLRSHYYSSEV